LILSSTLNPSDILTISLIVIGVAVLAGFRPAFQAARLDPIKALRHI